MKNSLLQDHVISGNKVRISRVGNFSRENCFVFAPICSRMKDCNLLMLKEINKEGLCVNKHLVKTKKHFLQINRYWYPRLLYKKRKLSKIWDGYYLFESLQIDKWQDNNNHDVADSHICYPKLPLMDVYYQQWTGRLMMMRQ